MANKYVLKGNSGVTVKYDARSTDTEVIKSIAVDLTSAQLLALYTTPITIISAPNSDEVIQFVDAQIVYKYATSAYTIGSATNLQFKYTDGSGTACSATASVTGLLDQSANEIRFVPQTTSAYEPASAAAIVLTLAGANVTGGAGTLTVKVNYRVYKTT